MMPPRLAEWWLQRCLPTGPVGESIRGDLIEEFRRRGPVWRTAWYWWHALAIGGSYVGAKLARRHHNATRHTRRPGTPSWGRDVRHAARLMRKRPAFTALAVATLGLGIGATSAIVSVVDRVLLRPLPYPASHELVTVWNTYPTWQGHELLGAFWNRIPVSYPEYVDWRDGQTSFQSVAIYGTTRMTLTGAGDPVEIGVGAASSTLFPTLRVAAAIGRFFDPSEEGDGFTRVAVVSHRLWRTRFGEAPDILDRTITLNGRAYAVIGVLPPDFHLRTLDANADLVKDVWVPTGLFGGIHDRGQHSYESIARLQPGITVERAGAEASVLLRGDRDASRQSAWAIERQSEEVGEVRGALLLLLGAVALLMLIATVNVATLFLAEATKRHQEIAMRAALGASRWRLVRQLTAESAVVGLTGAALGMVIAFAGVGLLTGLAPADLPIPTDVIVDARILAFTALLGLGVGLAFGVGPALVATRGHLGPTLHHRTSTAHRAATRSQHSLVAVESALSVVLLVIAGLLGRSLLAMRAVDPGFERGGLYVVRLAPNLDGDATVRLVEALTDRIAAVPGVSAVSVTNAAPFSEEGGSSSFTIEGRSVVEGEKLPEAHRRSVSANFHETLAIPLLAGRTLRTEDRQDAAGAVIISATMAQRYWPNESPLGSILIRDRRRWEVVGVVGDVLHADLTSIGQSTFYFAFAQQPSGRFSVIVRSAVPMAGLATSVRAAIWELLPEVALARLEPLHEMVLRSTASARYRAVLVAAFGACALVLAAVGMFGVTSRAVASRRRELGVRVALGATRRRIIHTVMRGEAAAIAAGITAGSLVALVASQWLGSFLFGVSTTDPVTFVTATTVLATVGLLASYLPARRAGALQPMEVLGE